MAAVGSTAGAVGAASIASNRAVSAPGAVAAQLDNVLADATIPELPNHYRGKVRDNYDRTDAASSSPPTG